jgi:hypothetical protein
MQYLANLDKALSKCGLLFGPEASAMPHAASLSEGYYFATCSGGTHQKAHFFGRKGHLPQAGLRHYRVQPDSRISHLQALNIPADVN